MACACVAGLASLWCACGRGTGRGSQQRLVELDQLRSDDGPGIARVYFRMSCHATAAAFDREQTFTAVEVNGAELFLETVSRSGATVDAGVIRKRGQTPPGGGRR